MESNAQPTGNEAKTKAEEGFEKSEASNSVPPRVPDHVLLRRIGRGGYGEVWLARNVMGTYRAVKVVYRDSFDHERPFEREFEGIRRFEPISRTHESQLNILHVGRGSGYFYYVMELADDQGRGQNIEPNSYAPRTLRSELHQKGRLAFEQCLRIALALTTALEHLHVQGLVHRDIKPSNVIFVGGVPKLADIGLVAQADATLSFVGTEGYVPPEGPGSPLADIYSLGKLLYEINTGRDRQDYPELPTDLRTLTDREDLVELNEVILKACQPNPQRRYASARQMHADLVLLQGGKSLARVHAMERRLAKWKKTGQVAAALSLVGAAGLFWQNHQTRQMRRLAEANLNLARSNKENADESRQRLARAEVVTGARLMDQGDLLSALPWFCGAATLDSDEPQLAAMHRFRLQSVLRQCPQLAQLFFHESQIDIATFDKTGDRVITGSADRTARIWDVVTGKQLGISLKHEAEVTSLAFSPRSNLLATASGEKTVRIWESSSGNLYYALPHPVAVQGVDFSPDGDLLLTVSTEGHRVWNVHTRELLYPAVTDPGTHYGLSPKGNYFATAGSTARVREVLTGRLVMETRPAKLTSIAFSADDRYLATGASDGIVQLWNISQGEPIGEPLQNAGSVGLLRFSPDNCHVLAGATSPLLRVAAIWDIASGHAVVIKHPAYVSINDAQFSPDGRHVVTGGNEGTARLWNASTGEEEGPSLLHGGPVLQVKFSPDGHLLLTVSRDGTGRLWDLAEMGFPVRTIKISGDLNTGQLSPDGRSLVTSSSEGAAQVWDTVTGQAIGRPMNHAGEVLRASFSHDGLKVVTGSKDGTAHVWDALTGEPLGEPLRHRGGVLHAAFSVDDRMIVTASEDGTVQLWTTATGKPESGPFRHETAVRDAALSPGNKLVLTVDDNGVGHVWDVETGKERTFGLEPGYQMGNQVHVEFSPDGERFLTVKGVAQVWEVTTGKAVTAALTLGSAEAYATFSPDGRRVATAAQDGTAAIWDVVTGHLLTAPMKHSQPVWRVAFDASGQRLATAGLDRTARLWDAVTGDPLTPPLRHADRVVGVTFSGDGERLLTLTPRGVVRIWDLSTPDEPLERTRKRVAVVSNRHAVPNPEASALSPQELREAWFSLYPQGANGIGANTERILLWHEQEAADSELTRQWQAAIFHLNSLIAAHPSDVKLRQRRAIAYDRIGDWELATLDDPNIRRCIPRREPNLRWELLDLSAYYNWPLNDFGQGLNHLGSLLTGRQTLGGIEFDVRGVIQLTDPSGMREELRSVRIPIHRKSSRLHFLHAAVFGLPQLKGREIGKYVIRYADNGQTAELPIIYGEQVLDWHYLKGESWRTTNPEVVWKGTNEVSRLNGSFLRLFKTTWENPNPALEISALELLPELNMPSGAAPFVVAITAED